MPRKTMVFKANAGAKYTKAVEDFYGQELQNSGASKNPYDIHMSFGASLGGVNIHEAVQFTKSIQNDIFGIKKTIYMVPEKIDLYIDGGNLTDSNNQGSDLVPFPTRDNNWLMVHYKKLDISGIKTANPKFQSELNSTKYCSANDINQMFANAANNVGKALSEYSKPKNYEPHVSIAKINHNNIAGFREYYKSHKGELFNKFVQNVPTLAIFDFKLEHITNNAQAVTTDLPLGHTASSWHSYFSADEVKNYAEVMRAQEATQHQDDKGKEPEDLISQVDKGLEGKFWNILIANAENPNFISPEEIHNAWGQVLSGEGSSSSDY